MNKDDKAGRTESPDEGPRSQELQPTLASAKCARTLIYVHCSVALIMVLWGWGEAPWLRGLERLPFLTGPIAVINFVVFSASLASLLTPLFMLGTVLAGRGSIRLGATLLTCDAVLALVQWQWLMFLCQ